MSELVMAATYPEAEAAETAPSPTRTTLTTAAPSVEPVESWDQVLARFDGIMPEVPAKSKNFAYDDFRTSLTGHLETAGLKVDEVPSVYKPASYNVVLASEAALANSRFFLKLSRSPFSAASPPKVYITNHARMHESARGKRKWVELTPTFLGNDPALLVTLPDGSDAEDDAPPQDYDDESPARPAPPPVAPATLTLVTVIPKFAKETSLNEAETMAQRVAREFEQYVIGEDGKTYSPFGLYTKKARAESTLWKANAKHNNALFGERCKMYVYIREVADVPPHEVKTNAMDMRTQAMVATADERKSNKSGCCFWTTKAQEIYQRLTSE